MLQHALSAPEKIYIDATAECNLSCRYCYHFDSPSAVAASLPLSEWQAFFAEASSIGVMHINISGGEPLTRPDLPELLTAVKHSRMRFDLITNGMLVTEDLARFVASTGRCNYVQISLDGTQAVHDSMRGDGSFAGAVRAMRLFSDIGVRVVARATIGQHNLGYLANTAEIAAAAGAVRLGAYPLAIQGLCDKPPEPFELDIPGFVDAVKEYFELCANPVGIEVRSGIATLYRRWQSSVRRTAQRDRCHQHDGHLAACNSVFRKMAVRADGMMIPCQALSNVELGRINSTPLKDAWARAEALTSLRRRRDIPLDRFERCAACEYMRYCIGGCAANSATDDRDPGSRAAAICAQDIIELMGKSAGEEFLNRY